jgi:hypothetical protein
VICGLLDAVACTQCVADNGTGTFSDLPLCYCSIVGHGFKSLSSLAVSFEWAL